jgi:ABC-type maltose transport system permease subunit
MAASETTTDALEREAAAFATRRRRPVRVWLRDLGWRYMVGLLAVAFALYPVAWILSASFNERSTLSGSRFIPEGTTLDNFKALFDNPLLPVGKWILNSWYIALVVAVLQLAMSTLAAYSFSRLRWTGRRVGLLALLLIQMFPQFLAFVAILLLLQQVGDIFPGIGLGTHAGLILVYLGGSLGVNTWLLKGFMDSIPGSLDEAAVMDGATDFQIFARVVFPLTRPVLAVVFIVTFVFVYGEYILASILLSNVQEYTLPVGLQLFVTGNYTAQWGSLAAAALLGALPIVIVYLFMQDQIVSGLTQGAVKG